MEVPAAVVMTHHAGRHHPPANDNRASLAQHIRRWLGPAVIILLVAAAAAYTLI